MGRRLIREKMWRGRKEKEVLGIVKRDYCKGKSAIEVDLRVSWIIKSRVGIVSG